MQAGALSIKLMADIVDVQRKMAQVQQLAQATSNSMAQAFSGLGAKIGGALSLGAIVAFVKQTANAIDAMNDLADATGASIEEISKLDQVARRNGQTLDQVGGILVKFNNVLKEADGKNGASIALQALGLEAAKLRQLDPAEALRQTAVALAGFADDGNKARFIQELFNKSVREAAPFLKDYAEAGTLTAKITKEQAEEAEKFNKQLHLLSANSADAARSLLSDLLPALNDILQKFNQFRANGGVMSGFVTLLASQFKDARIQATMDEIERLEKLLRSPNVTGFNRSTLQQELREAAENLRQLRGEAVKTRTELDKALGRADAGGGRGFINPAAAVGAPSLIDIAAEQARRKAADEAAIKAAKDRQTELDIQAKRQLANIAAYDKAEQELEEQLQRTLKAELDLAAARGLKAVAAYEAAEQAIDDSLAKAKELVAAINNETAALSMSNQEREIHNALLSLEATGLEKGTYAYEEYARQIREAVVNRETVRASIEQTQQIQREWERMSDQIGQSLTDALMQGGKSAWEYIKGLFRSMVLRPIVQAVVNPLVGATQAAVGSALGLSAGSAAAGSAFGNAAGAAIGSAIFGSSAAYGAAIGTTSIAAGSQAAMLAAQTGSFGAAGVAATSSAAAGAGSGFMATAAAAGPYVLAALAVLNAMGVFRSKKIVGGGLTGTLGEGDIQSYDLQRRGGTLFSGPDYSMVNQRVSAESQAIQTAYEALRTNAVNMAEALGLSSDAVKTFTTTLGTDITQNDIGTRGIKLDGLTPEEAAQKVQAALSQANEDLAAFVLGASRTVTETITTSVEDWAEGENDRYLRGYLDQVSEVTRTIEATGPSFARTGETAVQTLTRLASSISTINPVLELLGLQLFDTSLAGADLASTMADAFGGLENFTQVTAQYYQEFFSEAERTAHVTAQLTEALGGMGMTLPTTRDAFRDLVEAQDLTTEAGRKNFATLMQLSGTFAAITPVLEEVADAGETVTETLRSAADILNERQGLERQLLQLQGDTAALRALDRAALDSSNRALYDQITALEDAQAATAAAAQAAQEAADAERALAAERDRIAQERAGLERQLLQLQGDTNALRALDRAALDASNRALFDQITALEDAQAATVAAAQAAQEAADAERALAAERDRIAQERAGLERQLLQLQGDTTTLRAQDRAALDASNRALFDQITALEDAQAATAAAAQAAQEAADAERTLAAERERIAQERAGLERQLLQLQGDTAALRALDRAALDASNRALFDQITALEDAQAATAAAAQAAQEAADAERTLAAERERIAQERAGLERQLLELQGNTTALRALDRAALDASNRALFDQITALQDSQAATAASAQATQAAADAERALVGERAGLERQLLQLQGDTTTLRALDRAALHGSNRALYDQITALQDSQAATAASAQAAQAAADAERALAAERDRIAQERAGLERQLLQLQGDTTALRALDRAALDASNRALYDQITALQDSQAATAASAQAAQAAADAERALVAERERIAQEAEEAAISRAKTVAEERSRLERQLLELQGNTAALRALERAELAESNRALYDQITALQDSQAATAEATRKQQEYADAMARAGQTAAEEIERLRGVTSGASSNPAQLAAMFAITTAQARGGSADALSKLPQLSTALEAATTLSARNAIEVARMRAWLASSLTETLQTLGLQVPALNTGTNVVPQDMLAMLHKGEAVVPAPYNPAYGNSSREDGLVAEVRALRQEMTELHAAARSTAVATNKTARILERVTPDGNSLQTVVAA